MSVTEYLGQTKGSVSQTLKVLEKKNLITKTIDSNDKRVTHISVTEEGRELIQSILPSPLLQSVSNVLSDDDIAKINLSLSTILRTVQHENDFKSFGQCVSCKHNIKLDKNNHLCGLTKEPLSTMDIERICREHESSKSSKKVC